MKIKINKLVATTPGGMQRLAFPSLSPCSILQATRDVRSPSGYCELVKARVE